MKETNLPTPFPDYKPQTHQKNPVTLPQPKHSCCQAEKAMPSEAFTELSGRNKAQHCTPGSALHTWLSTRLTATPQSTTVTTHIPRLWGLLGQLPWPLQDSCANGTGQDFCYSSLLHTGQKTHLLGSALILNTDYGCKGSSSSCRAPQWDHKSSIPPGPAFLWLSPSCTGNWIPSGPRGNSYSDFQLNPTQTHKEIQQDTGLSSQGQSRAPGDGGQGTWVPSVTSWLPSTLKTPLSPYLQTGVI